MLRKITYKRWLPKETEIVDSGFTAQAFTVKGTGCFTDTYECEGLFHGWGLELHETSDMSCSYTVAIIEKSDGTIVTLTPNLVKFLN